MPSVEPSFRGFPCFYPATQVDWESWLKNNHRTHQSVWLILYKINSGKPTITFGEALDTALCYGWIDSRKNNRNSESYYLYFAARNPKSNWSRINKEKIAKLDAAGRLTSVAYEMIAMAKKSGTWNALDEVENLIVRIDLQEAFDQYDQSKANWDNFPRNVKRAQLEWIFLAKRTITRQKRIKEVVSQAQQNKRANK